MKTELELFHYSQPIAYTGGADCGVDRFFSKLHQLELELVSVFRTGIVTQIQSGFFYALRDIFVFLYTLLSFIPSLF